MAAEETRETGERNVNAENATETQWSAGEETLLLLAREMEWAEAYAEDHPDCRMGGIYLDFLRWEMITAQSDL